MWEGPDGCACTWQCGGRTRRLPWAGGGSGAVMPSAPLGSAGPGANGPLLLLSALNSKSAQRTKKAITTMERAQEGQGGGVCV